MPHLLPLRLAQRNPARIRPQLDALRQALHDLGHPERERRSILVVGTNGKGSTVAFLDSILRAHGLTTGRYTSPHLVRVEERILINGREIDPSNLERLVERLADHPDLTFFETLTAAAFLAFAEARVDCWILEAGMGGRWDATRLAESAIAGLTNVGTDHRTWLGPDRETIAQDKGAALAAATIAVVGPQVERSLWPWLRTPHVIPAAELVSCRRVTAEAVELAWADHRLELPVPFPGSHQVGNLHLAMALARAAEQQGWVRLEASDVGRGIERSAWPGRLTRHRIRGRVVLLDGAHNLEGTVALVEHLRATDHRPHLLFSCLDDKPLEEMAVALREVVDRVVVCPLEDPRAMPVERLEAAFPGCRVARCAVEGLELLPDPVLAAGSLRLVGALLDAAEEQP